MLTMDELIGLRVRVSKSTQPEMVGLTGTVADETMKTLTIQTGKKEVIIPKKDATFEFEYEGRWETVAGNDILFRPDERVKKNWRKMHGRMQGRKMPKARTP